MDSYKAQVDHTEQLLEKRFATLENKADILKSPEFKTLYDIIKRAPADVRPAVGKLVNDIRAKFQAKIADIENVETASALLDPTAPYDKNVAAVARPSLLSLTEGSLHPMMSELQTALNIFRHMGFETVQARHLDDDYHMFGSLNFPEGHPARDNWDSFTTDEKLLPIAHTTSMQNRLLQMHQPPVAAVSYGRCFRNEDLDATHEHTFYQIDGILVDRGIKLSDLLGTFQTFFENFFGEALQIRTQPAYFPFVEPGMEYLISKPESLGGKPGEWLEVMGCGMIHPNVLKEAGLDPKEYSGFAWGFGLDRLVMLKYGIEDVRYFESGRLEFLRKFA